MTLRPLLALSAPTVLAAALGCSALAPDVERVSGTMREDGRYISHLSYAAYAQGAELEALGQLEAAEASYRRAMDYDPQSWEIWTRLGGVRCAMKRADAERAFAQAELLAPDAPSLWMARARCEMSRGHYGTAVDMAKRSLELDPDDPQTTLLISEALRAEGHRDEARRWLVALAARDPGSPAAAIWLAGKRPTDGAAPPLRLVDVALLDAQLELASERALSLGLSEAELAAREVALGLTRQGFDRARAVLEADPADGSAWAVLLVAADLMGDEEAYGRALASANPELGPTDELSTLLLADLIKRRTSTAAARAWLEKSAATTHAADDELTAAVRDRLEHELANEAP